MPYILLLIQFVAIAAGIYFLSAIDEANIKIICILCLVIWSILAALYFKRSLEKANDLKKDKSRVSVGLYYPAEYISPSKRKALLKKKRKLERKSYTLDEIFDQKKK